MGAKLSASMESGKDGGADGMKEARGTLSASMKSGKNGGADGMELKEARGALSASMESDKDEGAVIIVNDYAHNKL